LPANRPAAVDLFHQVQQFEALLDRLPISPEAERLLLLMYSAANGQPPAGVAGEFTTDPEPLFIMVARNQDQIAKAIGVTNATAVRRVCRQLEGLGLLVRGTEHVATGGRRCYYFAQLNAMVEMADAPAATAVDDLNAAKRWLARQLNPPATPQQVDRPNPEPAPATVQQVARASSRRRFDRMPAADVDAIAGKLRKLPDGKFGRASFESRRTAALEYFADAQAAGFAEAAELRLFVAAIFMVADQKNVRDKPGYLRTCWANRNQCRPLVPPADCWTRADELLVHVEEFTRATERRRAVPLPSIQRPAEVMR
jgi:hypothetical protein